MLVTLISDVGNLDNNIAITKALLLDKNPNCNIIDITHEVMPYNLLQSSYLLENTIKYYPKGSFHISLINLFASKVMNILICEINEQYVIASDNGLIPLLTQDEEIKIIKTYSIVPNSYINWVKHVGDLISKINDSGTIASFLDYIPNQYPLKHRPIVKNGVIECKVIHIDRFENVVLNINEIMFREIVGTKRFMIKFSRIHEIEKILTNYNDVASGDSLARFNQSGYLEIAINNGKAASLLGLSMYNEKSSIYQQVYIEFESDDQNS